MYESTHEQQSTFSPPVQIKADRSGAEQKPKHSNPYSGTPLKVSGKLANRIKDSFGIKASELALRESPEVARMGAKATAQGNAIRFAPGEFRPDTAGGMQILGHELNHVREQATGGVHAAGGQVFEHPVHEAKSDAAGKAFAGGGHSSIAPVSVGDMNATAAPVQMSGKKKKPAAPALPSLSSPEQQSFLDNAYIEGGLRGPVGNPIRPYGRAAHSQASDKQFKRLQKYTSQQLQADEATKGQVDDIGMGNFQYSDIGIGEAAQRLQDVMDFDMNKPEYGEYVKAFFNASGRKEYEETRKQKTQKGKAIEPGHFSSYVAGQFPTRGLASATSEAPFKMDKKKIGNAKYDRAFSAAKSSDLVLGKIESLHEEWNKENHGKFAGNEVLQTKLAPLVQKYEQYRARILEMGMPSVRDEVIDKGYLDPSEIALARPTASASAAPAPQETAAPQISGYWNMPGERNSVADTYSDMNIDQRKAYLYRQSQKPELHDDHRNAFKGQLHDAVVEKWLQDSQPAPAKKKPWYKRLFSR